MYRFIQWRDDWLLHIADLDEEHRQLARLLNQIAERFGIMMALPRNVVGPTNDLQTEIYSMLEQWGKQVRRHFRHEERLMKELYFPEYEAHQCEHMTLLAEYADLLRDVRHRGIEYLDFQTLTALKTWFLGHIVGADKKFGQYRQMLSSAPSLMTWAISGGVGDGSDPRQSARSEIQRNAQELH